MDSFLQTPKFDLEKNKNSRSELNKKVDLIDVKKSQKDEKAFL